MLNKNIPTEQLKNIQLLILDSDGVTIPRGTRISQTWDNNNFEVNLKTAIISDKLADLINQLRKKIKICISSGRSLIYLQAIYSKIIGKNTILQAENGNLSLIEGNQIQHLEYDESYFETLSAIREDIKKLPISGFEPKQFILTVHAPEEIKEVYDIIKKHDSYNELKVMWNGEAFDIQKQVMSKGVGLYKLLRHFNFEKEEVIAIGDRVNDKELLDGAGIGVSADPKVLPAEYWTEGKELPGQQLAEYLLNQL